MDPFLAEIRVFPFNFPPTGWAFCNGQLLPISQNTALFALLGTTYGGDGKSTFALPDLRGCAPIHPGQGSGLSPRSLGQIGGAADITLLDSEIPAHAHTLQATIEDGAQGTFSNGVTLASSVGGKLYQSNTSSNIGQLSPMALAPSGASQPHNNMQPSLVLNFCIALQGIFPPRP